MPEETAKLCAAGLNLELMIRVAVANDELLMDQLLQGAGVEKAGDRLRIILFVRDDTVLSSSGGGSEEQTGCIRL